MTIEYDVKIQARRGDAAPVVVDDPATLSAVGGTMSARGDASSIAASVKAVHGATAALVETFVAEREKAYGRLLRAELAKLAGESLAIKSYFEPQPFEVSRSTALRDEAGRLVGTTNAKFRIG